MKNIILILVLNIGTFSIVNANELTKTNFYYDIQWGHITVGNINVRLEKKNRGVKLRVKSQSEGALSILYDYQSDLVASSYKQGKIWKGNSYMVNSFFRSQRYYSKVFWDKKTGKLDFDIKPPLDLEKVYDVPKLSLTNVVDPITAMLKVLEKINRKESCEDKLGIFDGRRRYNLSTKELKKEYLTNDRPRSFKGHTIVCGLKFAPIGGHRRKSEWTPTADKFSDIKIFFGIVDKGFHMPVRMHLNRWFGTITVRLLSNE